jgi:Fic family protein
VRGNAAAPGEYRKIQNYVINSKTKEVVYTPPAALEVPILMTELVEWLNREQEANPVIMAGIAQFQLVHIHPFIDGNGRTARLLSTLHLFRTGYDFKKLFTISEYYDRDRAVYYSAIQGVRKSAMDMTGWIEYFVEGLATQLKEVQEKAERVIKRDVLAKKYELKNCQQRAVAFILGQGTMTIQEYQKLCPKSARRTLQRELKEMVDNGVLVQEGATNRLSYRLKV